MRSKLIAASAAAMLLTGCDWQNGQANNAQANINEDSRVGSSATATNIAAPTGAPATKEEALKVMHDRHEAMEKIGKATKGAGRELKAGSPNLETIRASAKTIGDIAPNVASLFPPGTGPDVGKTGAKPAIWQNSQDFTAKTADFQKAAQAFSTAAAGSDVNAIKTAFGNLGNSCKACHEKYKAEMKR